MTLNDAQHRVLDVALTEVCAELAPPDFESRILAVVGHDEASEKAPIHALTLKRRNNFGIWAAAASVVIGLGLLAYSWFTQPSGLTLSPNAKLLSDGGGYRLESGWALVRSEADKLQVGDSLVTDVRGTVLAVRGGIPNPDEMQKIEQWLGTQHTEVGDMKLTTRWIATGSAAFFLISGSATIDGQRMDMADFEPINQEAAPVEVETIGGKELLALFEAAQPQSKVKCEDGTDFDGAKIDPKLKFTIPAHLKQNKPTLKKTLAIALAISKMYLHTTREMFTIENYVVVNMADAVKELGELGKAAYQNTPAPAGRYVRSVTVDSLASCEDTELVVLEVPLSERLESVTNDGSGANVRAALSLYATRGIGNVLPIAERNSLFIGDYAYQVPHLLTMIKALEGAAAGSSDFDIHNMRDGLPFQTEREEKTTDVSKRTIPLSDLISAHAKASGGRVVIHGIEEGKNVSIFDSVASQRSPSLGLALAPHKLAIVEAGQVDALGPINYTLSAAPFVLLKGLTACPSGRFVTTMIAPKHVDAAQLRAILANLTTRNAGSVYPVFPRQQLSPDEPRHQGVLIVSDFVGNVRRLRSIVALLDTPQEVHPTLRTFDRQVDNWSPEISIADVGPTVDMATEKLLTHCVASGEIAPLIDASILQYIPTLKVPTMLSGVFTTQMLHAGLAERKLALLPFGDYSTIVQVTEAMTMSEIVYSPDKLAGHDDNRHVTLVRSLKHVSAEEVRAVIAKHPTTLKEKGTMILTLNFSNSLVMCGRVELLKAINKALDDLDRP